MQWNGIFNKQRQPPEVFFKKRCSQKFCKIHWKTCTRVSFLWHRYCPVNFAKFLRAPFLQNTPGQLLLKKEGFLNQHLIKVSKLLVFVLLFSLHYFKYYGQNIFSGTVLYLIAKVERKEKTFDLKPKINLCQKKREAKCFRLRQ